MTTKSLFTAVAAAAALGVSIVPSYCAEYDAAEDPSAEVDLVESADAAYEDAYDVSAMSTSMLTSGGNPYNFRATSVALGDVENTERVFTADELDGMLDKRLASFAVLTKSGTTFSGAVDCPSSAFVTGKPFILYSGSASVANMTISLTFSDGVTTNVLPYLWGTTRLGSQYSAGWTKTFYARLVSGSMSLSVDADRDTDTHDKLANNVFYYQQIKAVSDITANTIVVGSTNGYRPATVGAKFNVGYPILYASAAVSAGSNQSADKSYIHAYNAYCRPGSSDVLSPSYRQSSAVYLNGTLDGDEFTITGYSYTPVRPCFPLGTFSAAATTAKTFTFNPGPIMLPESSAGGNYHVNSKIVELNPASCSFTCTNGSYSLSNGRLTWLFDGSSSSMQTRPTPGDYEIVVTASDAITEIGGSRVASTPAISGNLPLSDPIEIRFRKRDANTWSLVAHVADAANSFAASDGYYAYIDGFQPYTYDKPGYVAYTATNDAAAVVSLVDTIDISASTNGNERLVANAESVRRYTREQLLECMRSGEFWHYSPDGKISPDPTKVIIDQEVMFMGRFTYLTAGGMVAISADEGVSQVSTTGSVFRIGMFGNRDIEISGEERQLHINSFTLDSANDEWVIEVSTAFMENPNRSPVIRTVTNISYMYDGTLLWNTLDIAGTKSGNVWTFRIPNDADDRTRFFSAWAIQGEKKVHIGPKLELGTGQIVIDGNVFQPIEIVIGDVTLEVLGRVKD